ncbi:MAG: flagellar M-ring protein FliF C-terminal domain-containing protein [Vampirovibrionales bacterium]
MPPQIQAFLQNRQMVMLAGGGLVLIIVLIVAMVVFGPKKTELEKKMEESNKPLKVTELVLFKSPSEGKAIEVMALMAREGIPVQKTGEGQNIFIELKEGATQNDKDRALITLVQTGEIDATAGFELFDKSDMTASREDKKIKLLRAQQGELSRLIRKIRPIQDAFVQISMGSHSIFKQDERPLSASVQIVLPPSERLTRDKVRAIINLLVGAIQGLDANHVAISDTNGNTYSSVLDAVTDGQTLLEEKDSYMKQKVMSQLDKLVGTGHYVVTVSTFLRTANRETMVERYHPGASTVSTKQQFQENMGGKGSATGSGEAGGATSTYLPPELAPPPDAQTVGAGASITQPQGDPGVASGLLSSSGQEGGMDESSSSEGGYQRKGSDVNYQNSKTQYVETTPAGTVEEISIAVTLDESHVPKSISMGELKGLIARSASPKARPDGVSVIMTDFESTLNGTKLDHGSAGEGHAGTDQADGGLLTHALMQLPSNWWAIAGTTLLVLLIAVILINLMFPKTTKILPPSTDPQFNQAQQEFFQFREQTSQQQQEVSRHLAEFQTQIQTQMQQQTQQLIQEQTRAMNELQTQLLQNDQVIKQQAEALQTLMQQQNVQQQQVNTMGQTLATVTTPVTAMPARGGLRTSGVLEDDFAPELMSEPSNPEAEDIRALLGTLGGRTGKPAVPTTPPAMAGLTPTDTTGTQAAMPPPSVAVGVPSVAPSSALATSKQRRRVQGKLS